MKRRPSRASTSVIPSKRWLALANNPSVRRFVVALVGAALFLLGSAYLNLQGPKDVTLLKVVGGQAVRAGLPTSFRVVSSWAQRRQGAVIEVSDVRIDGESRLGAKVSGSPALVTLTIPESAGDEVQMAFDVTTEGRQETLHLAMPVRHMAPEPALPEDRPLLPETSKAHRISILPQAGVLAAGLDNRVFIRVRDLQGVPLNGAEVRVAHKSFSGGEVRLWTEGSGLASLTLDARRPSFRLLITVSHGGQTTEIEELLVPVGRQMLLSMAHSVVAPEAPIQAKLRTWQDDAEIYCDLLQGDVQVWSTRLVAEGGEATLSLGPWPEGRYHLQCSDHPWAMGQAYATQAVVVSSAPPLEALLTELRDQQTLHPSGLVSPPGTKAALALDYWQAILAQPPVEQQILLSTREADLSSQVDAHESQKTQLLVAIGLVFLLVLAWVAEAILKNIIDTRDRLRAYAAESFMDDTPVNVDGFVPADTRDRETLIKTRGILAATVFLGAIIGNIVGIIWLFALIR